MGEDGCGCEGLWHQDAYLCGGGGRSDTPGNHLGNCFHCCTALQFRSTGLRLLADRAREFSVSAIEEMGIGSPDDSDFDFEIHILRKWKGGSRGRPHSHQAGYQNNFGGDKNRREVLATGCKTRGQEEAFTTT